MAKPLSYQFKERITAGIIAGAVFLLPTITHAAFYRAPEIRLFDAKERQLEKTFSAFEQDFKGGVSVATGDFGGDGIDEIVIGAGPGGEPSVKVFRQNGSLLSNFLAYDPMFKNGIHVAAGDLNGDGRDEIITAPRLGTSHIQIFNIRGDHLFTPGFFAFGESFGGGAHVAAGDLNGDGRDEIIVGSGIGGSHVRIFTEHGNWTGKDFFPFSAEERGGVTVASANVDGGKEDEIVMAVHRYGKAWVKVYKGNPHKTIVGEFDAFPENFRGGVNVAGADVDHDGIDEVIVSANIGGGPHVKFFEAYGKEITPGFFAYEEDFRGGIFIAAGNVDRDSDIEIVTGPNRRMAEGRIDLYKYIEVDISEQKIFLYENGFLIDSYKVSTGLPGFPTPEGEFKIWRKRPSVRMTWFYGPSNPNNYDLPAVPWVLSFQGPYTLHGTYWHNNFGRRRSHGCVNLPTPKAKWLYDWAPLGTIVMVHP